MAFYEDFSELEHAKNYLRYECVWRVELARPMGQIDRVTWYETSWSETVEDVRKCFESYGIRSCRRATIQDAEEMVRGLEL